MRSFPRALRHRATATLAALVLVAGVPAVVVGTNAAASELEDLKERKGKVTNQLGNAQDDLRESSQRLRRTSRQLEQAEARLSTARSRLSTARTRLAEARAEDARMADRLAAAEERLRVAREELRQGRADVEEQAVHVEHVITSAYKDGDPMMQGFVTLLEAKDPADLIRASEAMRIFAGHEARTLDNLRQAEVKLAVQHNKVRDTRAQVKERRQAAADHLATMRSLEQEAQAATSRVADLVSRHSRARRAADKARKRDLAVIARLKQQQQRLEERMRKRAEELKKQAAAKGNLQTGPTGGYLNWPVKGYVTSSFGWRNHPIYGYRSLHDGVDFGTGGCGAPLYASANGTVMSRYYQTAWGNRLVIDHGLVRGHGLATIYNHAARYIVSPGQRVSRGQVIGYVGSTGWSTGCHLHFTVLQNGRPVDPFNWF
ncbi:peptidoglycan DD-metalloendopeptidase family protein [Nocardioides limicola]|uniref:peptidoglycan DD-metalloendopeptidase family protein n=1 Tax=Nocardioides limicola TaxID=2803368 RepID=UPI00193B6884|nr:M23 family metallopeptidase [Nocardioides sp. DJM-14]